MKHKKYLFRGILLFLLAATLFFWGILLPPVYEDTFLGELKYKYERLRSTPGRRLVVIGGSGVAFGIDSGLLQEYFPEYTPVNFGMYAGLGTSVMLDLAEDELREGDLVILMPEQERQTLSDYFNADYFWQAADGSYSMLVKAWSRNAGQLIGSFLPFAAEKARYHLKGKKPSVDGVYMRASFDDYGDIKASCPGNRMLGGYDPNQPILFTCDLLQEEWCSQVRDFAQKMEERGVDVFYHFCPMNQRAVEMEQGEVDTYCDHLRQQLQIPLLGNPLDSVLDAGWFYDTNFHLNTSGKRIFTELVIRDLKASLGDSAAVSIERPVMPQMENPEEHGQAQYDNSYDWAFTWQMTDGAVSITGLTEAGQKEKYLVVPAILEGYPVRTLEENFLSGNSLLEEIVVQDSIHLIRDGAFADTKGLKKIILTSERPDACLVGQDLLRDCQAEIYVPEEALDHYKLSYSWSGYASRIKEWKN